VAKQPIIAPFPKDGRYPLGNLPEYIENCLVLLRGNIGQPLDIFEKWLPHKHSMQPFINISDELQNCFQKQLTRLEIFS
jgi:hypothetical protein